MLSTLNSSFPNFIEQLAKWRHCHTKRYDYCALGQQDFWKDFPDKLHHWVWPKSWIHEFVRKIPTKFGWPTTACIWETFFSVPTDPEITEGKAVETVEPHGILYSDNRSVIVQSGYNMGKLSLSQYFYFFILQPQGSTENFRFWKVKAVC